MNYLLYGEDSYRSRKKLGEIIEEYRKKSGSNLSLHHFDGEDDDLAMLKQIAGTLSLFDAKQLVVVEYALASGEQFGYVLDLVRSTTGAVDTMLLLWDRNLDQNAKKHLAEVRPFIAKVQEFKPLEGVARGRWIRQEADMRGVKLSPSEVALLASGNYDSWGIVQQLDKMAVNPGLRPTPAGTYTSTIFQLGDTFFTSRRDGLRHLLALFDAGEDEFGIFSYLVNHVRTLATIHAYTGTHQPVPAQHGIHPFVIKKASTTARQLSDGQLHSLLYRFFEEDWRVKVGLSKPKDSLIQILLGAQRYIMEV
jgi:DNA polymerase III delta subunit